MNSLHDQYCSKCDVMGHEEGSAECDTYYAEVEMPHHAAKRSQIGKVRALTEETELWDVETNSHCIWLPEETPVRITNWTPWHKGSRSGDYWSICTLDREYSATQIKDYELGELGVLDKLALIDDEDPGTAFADDEPGSHPMS
jgi:hypothetical protein